MTKLDCTHSCGILLGLLLILAAAFKWRLVYFIQPYDFTVIAYFGSAIVVIYILGSLIGAIGLFCKKSWGCIASYLSAIGGTLLGISVIPWGVNFFPNGYTQTLAVIGFNMIFIIAIATIHVSLHRIKVRMTSSANN